MRSLIVLSAAALTAVTLSACSQGEEAAAPETASASASAGGAMPAGPVSREMVYAAASEGPEPFVRAIYAQYVNGGPQSEPPAPGRDPMYSRIMNALIGTDFRAAKGEVPTLSYDPVCGCQDQENFVVNAIAVAQAGNNAADADVAFTNMGEAKTLKLKLVREGPNWKIEDIIDGGVSLHDTLMEVAEAAA